MCFLEAEFHLFLPVRVHSFHFHLSQSSQSHMDIRCLCEIFLEIFLRSKNTYKTVRIRQFARI